jgi:hypothetical protein
MSHGTATSTGASTLPPVAPGAYASAVHIGDEKSEVATAGDAVRLPLPGGWVMTAWGEELHVADALAGPGSRDSA